MSTYIYRDVSEALPALCEEVLVKGAELASRGGSRVQEITYPHITLTDPTRREVLAPERRASLPAQIVETMWVLAGRNDVLPLLPYLPRAADFSDDGSTWRAGYGPRIRAWGGHTDQLRHVYETLRADATSRRAVIALYDPAVDTEDGKDIACNNWLHFLNRNGRLDMHIATRSNDLIWGWSGINQFEWSVLQEILANLLGLKVGAAHYSISSLHIYDRHWGRARRIKNAPAPVDVWYPSNSFRMSGDLDDLDGFIARWWVILSHLEWPSEEYELGYDDVVLGAIRDFPEPMMKSWLQALAWWWTGHHFFYDPLLGTRLADALLNSPRPNVDKEASA